MHLYNVGELPVFKDQRTDIYLAGQVFKIKESAYNGVEYKPKVVVTC